MSGPRIVIVGGGIYGWTCALRLAELGARATVVDPRPVHDADRASGGTTRVLRLEYGDAAVYSELTVRARERWREIERRTRTDLFRECGVLFLVPQGDDGAWERASLRVTTDLGHPGTVIEPGEIGRRWPAIRAEGLAWASFNPVGGFLWANRATASVAALARAAGATLRQAAAVDTDATGAALSDGSRVLGDAVILTTGAWTRRLVPEAPIRHTRQLITYAAGGPTDIPVFSEGAPFTIYGIPAHDGLGVKAASHDPGEEVDPDDPAERVPRPGEVDRALDYIRRRFVIAEAEAQVARSEVCFYALTPTEDPVIDRLPDGRYLCAGFSGHGFKFAPVLGAAVAEWLVGRDPSVALERFRMPA